MKRLSVITVAVLTVLSCGSCIKEKGEWRSSEGEDTKPGRQATAVQKTAESKEQPTYEVQIEQSDICSLGRVLVNGFPVDKWGGAWRKSKLRLSGQHCFGGGRKRFESRK